MPIPAAEKMRRYREKLKANLEKHESYLRKDRERKKRKIRLMGVREKKEYKKRHTESMKKHGRNKKVLQPPVQQVPRTSMPFSNRQTLGKVRRRVLESLLKSPRKKDLHHDSSFERHLHCRPKCANPAPK